MNAPSPSLVQRLENPGAKQPFDELARSGATLGSALELLQRITDDSLERPWHWGSGELDVRYGFYRAHETIADARATLRVTPMDGRGPGGAAWALVAPVAQARWSLDGLLAGLDDSVLDTDPGNDEWTVRQTLAHIVGGQRGYAWYTAWWVDRRELSAAGDFPRSASDDDFVLPEEEEEGLGTLDQIRRRFDDVVDLTLPVFGTLDEDDMASRARWSGLAVDVRFRMVRWASHIREHTIQVEKTLGFLGRPLTEVDRLVRLVADEYGRLEEDVIAAGLPAPVDSAGLVSLTAARVLADSESVLKSAGVEHAAVPASG